MAKESVLPPNAHKESITVDSLVIGDTPYSLSVQDTLRNMGETTYLIYTGMVDCRYMYVEDIDAPHCKLSYPVKESSRVSGLMTSKYKDYLRSILGGDYYFLYRLIDLAAAAPKVCVSIASVQANRFSRSRLGCCSSPSSIGRINKFVIVYDYGSGVATEVTVNYNKMIVTENLKAFLGRIGIPAPLESKNMGLILDESVVPLHGEITLGGIDAPASSPLFSISRGYLTYYFHGPSVKAKIPLLDYIRIPSTTTYTLASELESQDIYLVGPRALWNSGLSLSSETARLRYLYS